MKTEERILLKLMEFGGSRYYYLDAITSILTGFLYAISPYLSLACTLIFCLLSVFLASKFKEISCEEEKIKSVSVKEYLRKLKYSFRFIFKSNRLKSLILYGAAFYGFWVILATLRKGILQDIYIPVQYIGIIFAVFGLFSGLAAGYQNKFHKRFRNKLMTYLAIVLVSSTILSGAVVLLGAPRWLLIPTVLICFSLQFIVRGIYYTINKQYLNSFSTSELRTKIFSANTLLEGVSGAAIALICSFVLGKTSTATTLIIFGIVFLFLFIHILKYMKTRVGLKPEEYKRNDIPVEIK